MPPELTLAEQAATFVTSTHKDGEPSDGAPTAEEQAAAAANAAKVGASAEAPEEDDKEVIEGEESDDKEVIDDKAAKPGDEKPADDKAAKDPKNATAKRIGDLTAARRAAERQADTEKSRADSLAAELAALKSGKTPLTAAQGDAKAADGAPDPASFDYGELDPKYIAALARHETTKALNEDRAKQDSTRQADAAAAKQQETATKTDTLVKAGVALHDDFDEVVMQGAREGKWDLTPTFGELLLDSEFGPQIAYDLASDPDESRRIAKLSASQQAAHFGRLEAKFEAAKPSQGGKTPSKTPQAPPPPKTPKGGSGSNKVGADSSDFAAVEAAWQQGALR